MKILSIKKQIAPLARQNRVIVAISHCGRAAWRGGWLGWVSLMLIPFLWATNQTKAEPVRVEVIQRADQLPLGVQRMHQALLRAAMSGDIERMREVLESNELMPLINGQFVRDPVMMWKSASNDKSGREILALLAELLELPPVKKTSRNGVLYVWPYFAGVSLHKLSPREIVQLYRLAPASQVAFMLKNNRYTHFEVIIGADGTWHSFDRLKEKTP